MPTSKSTAWRYYVTLAVGVCGGAFVMLVQWMDGTGLAARYGRLLGAVTLLTCTTYVCGAAAIERSQRASACHVLLLTASSFGTWFAGIAVTGGFNTGWMAELWLLPLFFAGCYLGIGAVVTLYVRRHPLRWRKATAAPAAGGDVLETGNPYQSPRYGGVVGDV